ncbi:similar to Saccharomyces cerevisiae YPL150W Putative protein kinase of unknown cellular role [Maudiozyma saulgeensis]|uniref:non-specific serine/threonine protein kinase n=1 Tax=Maudiozyma saulgeensis TaxID=1789683 RepID=A0A1X7R8X3_9SACH|nr:similar to Saccharomyces cerevisiae YPL150W Putative protein kinase of unknown cellular role [Kazachstania saulgeensis]
MNNGAATTITKAEQNNIKAIIGTSYNKLYSQFQSDELCDVGNYKILNQIGEGSFGKVYLACHKLTHHKVVLKTSDKKDPNIVREVFYHRQFNYPHITKLYEVIVTETKVWMALEYCSGKELYDHLLKMKRIPINQCIELFSQICGAVYYAHSLNCVHRDLKLENILLDKDGKAKLTDFGFTRECMTKSMLETVCGTTVYMAPELTERKIYDGFKIDIWALGVILYTMMTGSMPFDEEDQVKIKWKIVNSAPDYNSPVITEDAKDLLTRLLSKDPINRPTMKEILEHPFLRPYGSTILKDTDAIILKQRDGTSRFHSKRERRLLKMLRRSGFDVHAIKNSVIKRKCDNLSGLWFLLLDGQIKHDHTLRPRRNKSVLSVRNVFDGPKSSHDNENNEGIIRTSLELTKVASIGKMINKTADTISLSPIIHHISYSNDGITDKVNTNNSVEEPINNKNNIRVSSMPAIRENNMRKNNNIFKKVSDFFKQKKYLNSQNGLTDEFLGTDNRSMVNGSVTQRSQSTNGLKKASRDRGDLDSKRKSQLTRPKSKTVVEFKTTKKPIQASNKSTTRVSSSGEPNFIGYEQPVVKRFKSTTSSDTSRQASLLNYDGDSLRVVRSSYSDIKVSPKLSETRPLSNVSQFSNDTNTSDYSTDGNTTFQNSFDSSAKPALKHGSSQYSLNSNSELGVKPPSSRKYLRRNLSVRSEASSASERSSRTDSFYDITTTTTQIKPFSRNKNVGNPKDSVLPHFSVQKGNGTWPSPNSNKYMLPRRSSLGRRRRNKKPSFLNNSQPGADDIIREESSSVDDDSDIQQGNFTSNIQSNILEKHDEVVAEISDNDDVSLPNTQVIQHGHSFIKNSNPELSRRDFSGGSEWSAFQNDSKSFITGTEDEGSIGNADNEESEDHDDPED